MLKGDDMLFNRAFIFLYFSFIFSTVNAAELSAKLISKIELFPSCFINNQIVETDSENINLGELDFGEATSSFTGVIETSLSGNNGAGIQIKCSGMSSVKLIFGSGLNDTNVPSSFSQNYYHSLSNGEDYIAYNLLYGSDKQVIRPNDEFILNNVSQSQSVSVFGRAVNDGNHVSMGTYTDIVPITVEF